MPVPRQRSEGHKEIAAALSKITARVAKLEVYLTKGNGGLTILVKGKRGKRVKFDGSLSLPWLVGILGGGSGAGRGIGRVFGA